MQSIFGQCDGVGRHEDMEGDSVMGKNPGSAKTCLHSSILQLGMCFDLFAAKLHSKCASLLVVTVVS